MSRVALVTGGSRGIGKEILRGLAGVAEEISLGTIVFTSTSEASGTATLQELRKEFPQIKCTFILALLTTVEQRVLDARDVEGAEKFAADLVREFGTVSILINNAGVIGQYNVSLFDTDLKKFSETYSINTLVPLALIKGVIPGMKAQNYGRIVNLGSAMGQITTIWGKQADYSISKLSLNAITRIAARELEGFDILVNSADPGVVDTDMALAFRADYPTLPLRAPRDGAATPVWLAALPQGGPSGGYFLDREQKDTW